MRKRWVFLFVLVALILTTAWLARHYSWMDWMVRNEGWLREQMDEHPWRSWAIGFFAYFVLSLIPGTAGKAVISGWLYGIWAGSLLVDIALTLAALVMFSISRFWIRDTIRSRFAEQVQAIDRRFQKYGATNLLMLRTAHVPYSFVNYVTGAMDVPYRTFAWTTALGLLPGTLIFVFVGTQLPTLRELQKHGAWVLLDAKLIAALAATVLLSFIAHLLVRWLQGDGVADQKASVEP